MTAFTRLTRRFALGALALGAACGFSQAPAQAQDYPNRPIHIYIGFPAGSGADILGRYYTNELEKVSGKPIIVENKPGATSNLALGLVANAKPDGYSLVFIANSNMAGSRYLFKNLPFDTVNDFTPIASFAQIAFVFVVKKDSPIKTIGDLTDFLKKNKQSKYGYTNQTALISAEAYKVKAGGLEAQPVLYRTAPDALPDVMNGTLDFMVMDGTFAAAPVRDGRIRAIAVTTSKRSPTFPDVPTVMEGGIPDYDFSPWWGVYGPKNLPQEVVTKVGGWMKQIATTKEAAAFLEKVGSLPMSDDAKGVAERLQRDIKAWEPVIKAAKIEPQG